MANGRDVVVVMAAVIGSTFDRLSTSAILIVPVLQLATVCSKTHITGNGIGNLNITIMIFTEDDVIGICRKQDILKMRYASISFFWTLGMIGGK